MDIVQNPFDHIFYEIQMYLATYADYRVSKEHRQLLINLLIDSRAIHLRNLAYFFKREKKGEYWHACDFVSDISNVSLIDDILFDDIKEYSSRATCHLLDYRLDESYKQNTNQCFNAALPVMMNTINSFLMALEVGVKQEYKNDFENETIQNRFKYLTQELLALKARLSI